MTTNFRSLRITHDYTQKYVADYLGVERTTYVRYENGRTEAPYHFLFKLGSLYSCSIDYLLGRDFETKKEAPQAAELSGMEETVLILFRGLDREDKAALLSYLHFLSYTHAQKEDAQRSDSADTSAG